MDTPNISSLALKDKTVLIRGDLDFDFGDKKNPRLSAVKEILKYVLEKGKGKVVLLGHKGRPKGEFVKSLSLMPMTDYFRDEFDQDILFLSYDIFPSFSHTDFENANKRLYLVENLRFWPGEQKNEEAFSKKIVENFDPQVFVNEAFAVSHRTHASINALPKLLKKNGINAVFGLRFSQEIKNLSKVFRGAKKPVVIIIGGKKEDKLDYLSDLQKKADKLLIGGRLPDYIEMGNIKTISLDKKKLIMAHLIPDKEDITVRSIEKFEEEIKKAGTIVFAGPMGKFEDAGHQLGTKRILAAIASASAFKIAGGGDSEQALEILGAKDSFDWISVGGGAMLEFLAKETLPGIQAIAR